MTELNDTATRRGVSDTQAGGHTKLIERLRKSVLAEEARADSNYADACQWMARAENAERELALLRTQKEKLVEALKQAEQALVRYAGEPPLYRDPFDAERRPALHAGWKAVADARRILREAGQ